MASPGPCSLYLPHLLNRSHPPSLPEQSRVTSYEEEQAEGGVLYEEPDLSYVQPAAQDDQPLDLTVTSRPRAGSSGSPHGSGSSSSSSSVHERALSGGSLACPHHPPSPPQRLTLPAVCHQAGCGCASPAPGPNRSHSHPTLHHAAHYAGHRHSPYPLQYSPPRDGPRYLRLPGGSEVDYAPPSPRGAPLPLEQRGSVSPPEYVEMLRRSPLGPGSYPRETSLSPYASEALLRQGASPGAQHHLYPSQLPHSTASPPSLSPRPWGGDHDGSPRPSTGQASSGRARDLSTRTLYRPFEEGRGSSSRGDSLGIGVESTSFSQLSSSVSSSFNVLDRGHPPSDDDLTASSSLLLLSLQPQSQPGRSDPLRVFKREEDEVIRPSQSDGEQLHYHQLVSVSHPSQSSLLSRGDYQASSKPVRAEDWIPAESSSRFRSGGREVAGSLTICGPAQDHTVASTSPTLYPESHPVHPTPRDSPHPLHSSEQAGQVHGYHTVTSSSSKSSLVPHMQQRVPRRPSLKVVGSSPLVLLREKRAQRQLKQFKENVRSLIAGRGGHLLGQQRDEISGEAAAAEGEVGEGGEAAVEEGSTGQASPGASSSTSSSSSPSPRPSDDRGLDRDFPIPPDPHLKMSALDYLISEVLVKRIDVPFKPYNKEVNDIFTGVKKGRLTLVDLIELRVEASLKAS